MKKILLVLLILHSGLFCYAKNGSLFSYDAIQVEKALFSVNMVDEYVSKAKVSADKLQFDNFVLKNFIISSVLPLTEHPVLGIPSFCWGFFLNGIGVLIVYMLAEDKKEIKMAINGCVVNSTILILSFSWFALIFALGTLPKW